MSDVTVVLEMLKNRIVELEAENRELRRQITIKDASLERKNRELDALHFVWCSGGCEGGVHRWQDVPLTEDIVVEAERNTRRLREWWESSRARDISVHYMDETYTALKSLPSDVPDKQVEGDEQ